MPVKQGSTVPRARLYCSTGKLATVFYDAWLKPDLTGMTGVSTIAGFGVKLNNPWNRRLERVRRYLPKQSSKNYRLEQSLRDLSLERP